MIQYLDLGFNKIKNIEAHVFDELIELKWISFYQNNIEEILYPIFAKNKKLEYINLSCINFQSLHSNLFDGLDNLEEVRFSQCNFDKSNMKMIRVELKPLFDSYFMKYEIVDRVKELEVVSFFKIRLNLEIDFHQYF
jgi:hypothetical protein